MEFDVTILRRQAKKDITDYENHISELKAMHQFAIDRSNFVSNELSDPEAIDHATLAQIVRLWPNTELALAYRREVIGVSSFLNSLAEDIEFFQKGIANIKAKYDL